MGPGGPRPEPTTPGPLRAVFVGVEGLVGMAAVAGTGQLLADIATPPDKDLPFGWQDWTVPGVWLFATVALPSLLAAALALRASRWTADAVIGASTALAVEVLVQIPFVGPSILQLICGAVAIVMAVLAWRVRPGWRATSRACRPAIRR